MLISYWLDVMLENNKVIQGCESSIHMVYRLVGDHLDTTGSKGKVSIPQWLWATVEGWWLSLSTWCLKLQPCKPGESLVSRVLNVYSAADWQVVAAGCCQLLVWNQLQRSVWCCTKTSMLLLYKHLPTTL